MENVILSFIEQVRDDLDLLLKQKALCIFDVYRPHQDKKLLTYMEEKGIKVVFVPAACKDRLQPLDVQINGKLKSLLKSLFQSFYANEVKIGIWKWCRHRNIKYWIYKYLNITTSCLIACICNGAFRRSWLHRRRFWKDCNLIVARCTTITMICLCLGGQKKIAVHYLLLCFISYGPNTEIILNTEIIYILWIKIKSTRVVLK